MAMTLRWWTCALWLAGTASGCSESHDPGGDGDADADADSDSDSDTDTDGDGDADVPNACDDACADEACCAVPDGFLVNHYCTDLTIDGANCGECGHSCGFEQICQDSQCGCWFGSPCGDRCFDLQNDAENCGGCGVTCPDNRPACRGGACLTCEEAGLLDCGGVCVRAEVDDRHCGACGNACEAATECVGSTCVGGECDDVDCLAGSACCDHVYGGVRGCADLRTDPFNCGGCGIRCLQGDACVDGGCGCSPWQTLCGDDCVDTNYDPSNCGECGNRCDREHPLCFEGGCTDCGDWGMTACGGQCVGLDWDPANCGECGVVCDPGEYCNMGNCEGQ